MSEYPEDVMKAARKAVMPLLGWESPDGTRIIARAIMAERERCAKAARERFTEDSVAKTVKGEPYITGKAAIYAGCCIADLIEKGGQA